MSPCVASGAAAKIAAVAFTLAWTHSVEHVRWEADWQVGFAGLELVAARVRGSAAGMEQPEGARLGAGAPIRLAPC